MKRYNSIIFLPCDLEYNMMSYCTYAVAAVCVVLCLVIVSLCMRYEKCGSKKKKRMQSATEKDEQVKPLASQLSQEVRPQKRK